MWPGSSVRRLLDRRHATEQKIWRCAEGKPSWPIAVGQFEHLLDLKVFWLDEDQQPRSIRYVMEHEQECPTHWRRIRAADMHYPLILAKMQSGQWDVIDGLHRLVKALCITHQATVQVCVITTADV